MITTCSKCRLDFGSAENLSAHLESGHILKTFGADTQTKKTKVVDEPKKSILDTLMQDKR